MALRIVGPLFLVPFVLLPLFVILDLASPMTRPPSTSVESAQRSDGQLSRSPDLVHTQVTGDREARLDSARLQRLEDTISELSLYFERTLGEIGVLGAQSKHQSVRTDKAHAAASAELNSLRRDLEALQLLVRTHAAEIPSHAAASSELNGFRRDLDALQLLHAAEITSQAAASSEINSLKMGLDTLQLEIASRAAVSSEINSIRSDLQALQLLVEMSQHHVARPDFALRSTGASVIPSLTSPTYTLRPSTLPGKILGYLPAFGFLMVVRLSLLLTMTSTMVIAGPSEDRTANSASWQADKCTQRYGSLGYGRRTGQCRELEAWRAEMSQGAHEPECPKMLPQLPEFIRIAALQYDIYSPNHIQTSPSTRRSGTLTRLSVPNTKSHPLDAGIIFTPCMVLFLDTGGAPNARRATNAAKFFFCALCGAIPGCGGFPGRGWYPPKSVEPPARPERSQTRIGVPKSHAQKHTANFFFLRPIRRCSRTRGHYPRLRSPLLKPPSPAEPPARPERAQTRIGVPKSHPQKHTANFFFLRPHRHCSRTRGALPASSKPSARPPALPAAPRRRGDFQIRISSNIRAKSAAGNSLGRISSSFGNYERAVGVDGPAVSLPPSTTPVFLVLLPSASLGPGFSCTVQNFSRTLSEIFFVFPLILHHLPSPSHISGPHLPQQPSTTPGRDEPFLTYRATRPYAKEGPGWCYNIACAADVDIAQHAAGTLTDGAFLARMKWKVGHTNDWRRRQREYRGCDVGKTHIWICGWEVSRRYYCERLAQLEELCDGGERATIDCVCGVSHREYFSFATVGGFTEFSALMTRVITYMNEQPTCSFFDLPPPPPPLTTSTT
ncbi:hypothetical protein B0H14DRAFT_3525386 [Mycena olivaceomarginata]|nr:hypothetical protein B0H14DRAFT_3525386 [Mycena olivaceomarginata]